MEGGNLCISLESEQQGNNFNATYRAVEMMRKIRRQRQLAQIKKTIDIFIVHKAVHNAYNEMNTYNAVPKLIQKLFSLLYFVLSEIQYFIILLKYEEQQIIKFNSWHHLIVLMQLILHFLLTQFARGLLIVTVSLLQEKKTVLYLQPLCVPTGSIPLPLHWQHSSTGTIIGLVCKSK